ncbi:MAG: hypothetical protein AAF725_10215 [Acidobacteriota bacterium]
MSESEERGQAAGTAPSEASWEQMQRAWQRPPEVDLPDLQALTRRSSLRIWLLTALDGFFTLGLVAWMAAVLADDASLENRIFVAVVSAVIAISWIWVLRVRRGTWRLDTAAPRAMLDLSIRRCRASVRMATTNQTVIVGAVALSLALRAVGYRTPSLGFEGGLALSVAVWVFAVAFFFASGRYRKRKTRELEGLLAVRDQMS